MTDAERKGLVTLLGGTNESGEATAFQVLLKQATPDDLRVAIHECLLTANSTCCNRRRMGRLANELLGRVLDGFVEATKWEIRALDAEGRLRVFQEKEAAQAPSAKPPVSKKARGKR